MIAIEVQVYGDFDMPATVAVMIAPDGYDMPQVAALRNDLNHYYANVNEADGAIKELKRLGFKALKTVELTVGGNL